MCVATRLDNDDLLQWPRETRQKERETSVNQNCRGKHYRICPGAGVRPAYIRLAHATILRSSNELQVTAGGSAGPDAQSETLHMPLSKPSFDKNMLRVELAKHECLESCRTSLCCVNGVGRNKKRVVDAGCIVGAYRVDSSTRPVGGRASKKLPKNVAEPQLPPLRHGLHHLDDSTTPIYSTEALTLVQYLCWTVAFFRHSSSAHWYFFLTFIRSTALSQLQPPRSVTCCIIHLLYHFAITFVDLWSGLERVSSPSPLRTRTTSILYAASREPCHFCFRCTHQQLLWRARHRSCRL